MSPRELFDAGIIDYMPYRATGFGQESIVERYLAGTAWREMQDALRASKQKTQANPPCDPPRRASA